jgi:site-specific recombinase XerD
MARATSIYSYGTADEYKSVWHEVAEFAKQALGVKNIEKINDDVVRDFLLARVDAGVALSTYNKESSAITKLEVALNLYAAKNSTGNQYDFKVVQKEIGALARQALERSGVSRAYDDPRALVSAIDGDESRIVASIQLEGGARVSEALVIKENQLLQNNTLHLTNTKGGLQRDIQVSAETYSRLRNHIERHGEFRHDYSKYYNDLMAAALNTSQKWQATHGLRWNFGQQSFSEKQRAGMSYHESLQAVSKMLGHHRGDITEHYLR